LSKVSNVEVCQVGLCGRTYIEELPAVVELGDTVVAELEVEAVEPVSLVLVGSTVAELEEELIEALETLEALDGPVEEEELIGLVSLVDEVVTELLSLEAVPAELVLEVVTVAELEAELKIELEVLDELKELVAGTELEEVLLEDEMLNEIDDELDEVVVGLLMKELDEELDEVGLDVVVGFELVDEIVEELNVEDGLTEELVDEEDVVTAASLS
jgi:hypothetical protein